MNNSETKETKEVTPTVSSEETKDETATPTTSSEVTKETKEETATPTATPKEETPTAPTTTVIPLPQKKTDDEIKLKDLDIDFTKDLMSVPTYSEFEFRMVTYITLWARRHGVKHEFDEYGNLYLTKGEVKEGEYYPCVTSHLDTVQTKQKAYAQAACPLDLLIRKSGSKHELYVNGMGIGADCKTGLLISLSLFDHFDAIKAAFFLEEEIGMKGSAKMNVDWFKNVGYVIGWDSPELNRAAWSCSGTKLMNKDFFVNNIQDICKKHGLTTFNAEPYTDVKHIREKTDIICMNFGNGGYLAHSNTEYMVLEDTDHALTMGIELIENLGKKKYSLVHKEKSYAWVKQADGTYKKPEDDKDEEFFRKLSGWGGGYYSGGNTHRYYDEEDWDDYYGYGGYSGGTKTSGTTTTSKPTTTVTTPKTTVTPKEETVSADTVKYISDCYEEHVANLKKSIEERCNELNIDFAQFANIFEEKIKF